jgi:hypothetical protein
MDEGRPAREGKGKVMSLFFSFASGAAATIALWNRADLKWSMLMLFGALVTMGWALQYKGAGR